MTERPLDGRGMQARILRMLDKASPEQVDRALTGSNSYNAIHHHAEVLADEADVALETSAAIIAVTSPLITWEQNVDTARRILAGAVNGSVGPGLRANVAKAIEIRNGAPILSMLRGRKVRDFYFSIVHPDNLFTVCVDRHVGRVALGWHLSVRAVDAIVKSTAGYTAVADAYRETAETETLRPLELQAIAWLVCREGLYQRRLF